MRDDDYDDDDVEEEDDEPGVPPLLMTAGIIWLVVGALLVLGTLFEALLIAVAAKQAQGGPNSFMVGMMCGMAFRGVVSAVFVYVGIQTILGRAADTLGNGIGSILFGLLQLGGGLMQFVAKNPLGGFLAVGAGSLLFVGGILAIVGRTEYKQWKKLQRRARKKRRRVRRREEYDED